jgi:hypothetical protein
MGKRTINLVLEIIIEIIDWFKTRDNKENGRKNDSKRNRKEKSKG